MLEIITGFKTEKDVEETLKWIEENTDFCWWDGDKPTKYSGRKEYFKDCKSEGGFYIEYGNDFWYCSIGRLKKEGGEYKEINFKDLIWKEQTKKSEGKTKREIEATDEQWEEIDKILV